MSYKDRPVPGAEGQNRWEERDQNLCVAQLSGQTQSLKVRFIFLNLKLEEKLLIGSNSPRDFPKLLQVLVRVCVSVRCGVVRDVQQFEVTEKLRDSRPAYTGLSWVRHSVYTALALAERTEQFTFL